MELLRCRALLLVSLIFGECSGQVFVSPVTANPRGFGNTGQNPFVGGSAAGDPNSPVVQTWSGLLRGRLLRLNDSLSMGLGSQIVKAFEGIPFALPPTGLRRMQPPVPSQSWRGVYNARRPGAACVQSPDEVPVERQSEDCLFLNVYSPRLPRNNQLLPVMVYIHGGGFSSGQGAAIRPDWLVPRGVVLVTLNYRLGALGFFHAGREVPGNVGMWDQALALQWVQDNVGAFGGDKGRVTIFGESAGAASVSLHTYSPVTGRRRHFQVTMFSMRIRLETWRGLKRAIAQSGSGMDGWAIEDSPLNPGNGVTAKGFAVASGCSNSASWDRGSHGGLGHCLRDLPVERIREASAAQERWSPTIDGPGGFLPSPLKDLAGQRDRSLNIMIGVNKDEFAFFQMMEFLLRTKRMTDFDENAFEETIREITPEKAFGDATEEVRQSLRNAYKYTNGAGRTDQQWARRISNVMTDIGFGLGALQDVQQWLAIGNHPFVYQLDYQPRTLNYPENYASVFHTLDLFFLFPGMSERFGLGQWRKDGEDRRMTNLITGFWTNFAITGNPNGPAFTGTRWDAAQSGALNFLSLDSPPSMRNGFQRRAATVWGPILGQPQSTASG